MNTQKLISLTVFITIIFGQILLAQTRFQITGRVAGEKSGNWLMGSNVVVLNTSIGTATNQDG